MFSKSPSLSVDRTGQRAIWGWLAVSLCMLASYSAIGKVYLTTEAALERAFPDARIERGTVYLTDEQVEAIEELAQLKLRHAIVHPYRAYDDEGILLGTTYFDAHLVRTLPETLMIVVSPNDAIARIDVLEFKEPEDYLPSERWYAQFPGRKLDRDLQLKRGIDGVTGATLTARATTSAARRALAIHHVLTKNEDE